MRKEVVDWFAYLRNSVEYNTNKPMYRKQERLRDRGVLVGESQHTSTQSLKARL